MIGIGNRMLEDRHLVPGIGKGKGRFLLVFQGFWASKAFQDSLCRPKKAPERLSWAIWGRLEPSWGHLGDKRLRLPGTVGGLRQERPFWDQFWGPKLIFFVFLGVIF